MESISKKLVKKSVTIGLLLSVMVGLGIYTNVIKLPIEGELDVQYVADFTNDRVLVGASHNVFVGKVIKQEGNKDTGIGPETQFAVEIILNVKGNLSGTVLVDQQGGYKNGILYLVHDADSISPETGGDALLKPGSTYLFTSRYDAKQNWYLLIPHPNGRKLLSDDAGQSSAALLELAVSDVRVLALQEAYKDEILLEADVKNNNTRNSYQSLQK